ncbi:MAG: SDR family oxidoreductase [Leptospiraceae bacterium]|jgi:NAD(P)-dependent dehydrogenase (short-subunit alcohol dehydrogenase family)|nr:SDR family oxidoreductase [Leptospiraceae bacterium]
MKENKFNPLSVYKEDLFKGKTVLITGGGSGIGKHLTESFLKLGADVIISSRDEEKLSHTKKAFKEELGKDIHYFTCDISKPEEVRGMVNASFAVKGKIDILINNAGANTLRPTEALTPVRWKAIIDTVLSGTYYVTREVAKKWLKAKFPGNIINIASTTGWTGSPFMAPSGAAKAGIINLGRTLGSEWGKHGIRINDVSPGPVFTKGSFQRLWLNEEIIDLVQKKVPLGKFPGPEDVVGPVLFLASPAADMITGSTITVDGGEALKSSFGELVDKFRPRKGDAGDID